MKYSSAGRRPTVRLIRNLLVGAVGAVSIVTASSGALQAGDILDGTTPGTEALELLDAATLATVAATNGESVERISEILATQQAAKLMSDGVLVFEDDFGGEAPPVDDVADGEAAQGPFPNGQTFQLHSRPSSNRTLYLDFDGYALPAGTIWNGGAAYSALAWDADGNVGSFNQVEIDIIQSAWQRVAEDYAAFDIDVTTEDPGYAAINRSSAGDDVYGTRVAITSSPSNPFCSSGCGGVSALGNIDEIGAIHDQRQPSWAFAGGSTHIGFISTVISHEAGHAVGLLHDGQKPLVGNTTGFNFSTDRFTLAGHGLANNTLVRFSSVGSGPNTFVVDQLYFVVDASANEFGLSFVEGGAKINASSPPGYGGTFTLRRHVEYYGGHGMWAPLMGNPYTQPVTTWSAGEYVDSTNTEDDFAVVGTNGVGLVPDDAPGFNGSPTNDVQVGAAQLIGKSPAVDTDSWRYIAPCSGTYDIYVVPDPGVSPNLSIDFSIWEWGNNVFLANDLSQPVRVNDDLATGMGARIVIDLVAGTPYMFWVQGLPNGTASTGFTNYANVGTYEIVPFTPGGCTPTNDYFLLADTMTGLDTTVTGSNVGYTAEVGEPNPTCDFGSPTGPTAWWKWTAPATQSVTFDTIGSTLDTVLAAYTGTSVDALTEVACNDQGGVGSQSVISFAATAGTTYWLQVDGYFGATGSITLNNRATPVVRAYGAVINPEGDVGNTQANLFIFLEDQNGNPTTSTSPINLNWTTGDVPSNPKIAHPGEDFIAAGGLATIVPGQLQITVPVQIIGDTVDEPPLLYGEWGIWAVTDIPSGNATINVTSFFGIGLFIIIDDD